ncbi:MAG: hypothetical protein V4590_10380 [Bacteroidota bacterium]
MEVSATQQSLFYVIKSKLLPDQSLPRAVAECLNVGIDAAYKRINGQRSIDMVEFELLLTRFHISLHDLESPVANQKVWFSFMPIGEGDYTYKTYLRKMITDLTYLKGAGVKHIIYSAKEVPMFYNFMFPELGCFKSFVWQKSILQLSDYATEQFSVHHMDEEIIELGQTIYELFLAIDSKEIWNYETVNCTFRQIEFYRTSKLFADAHSEEVILNQYQNLIRHIEKQTASGCKLDAQGSEKAKFDLYHNELILGDNSVLAHFENNSKLAFITPNAVNTFSSPDERVTRYLDMNLQNIINKSVKLSKQSEKLRAPFFDTIYKGLAL